MSFVSNTSFRSSVETVKNYLNLGSVAKLGLAPFFVGNIIGFLSVQPKQNSKERIEPSRCAPLYELGFIAFGIAMKVASIGEKDFQDTVIGLGSFFLGIYAGVKNRKKELANAKIKDKKLKSEQPSKKELERQKNAAENLKNNEAWKLTSWNGDFEGLEEEYGSIQNCKSEINDIFILKLYVAVMQLAWEEKDKEVPPYSYVMSSDGKNACCIGKKDSKGGREIYLIENTEQPLSKSDLDEYFLPLKESDVPLAQFESFLKSFINSNNDNDLKDLEVKKENCDDQQNNSVIPDNEDLEQPTFSIISSQDSGNNRYYTIKVKAKEDLYKIENMNFSQCIDISMVLLGKGCQVHVDANENEEQNLQA